MWLPHPSDALWQTLASDRGPVPRREDIAHRSVRHPLLATLGRDRSRRTIIRCRCIPATARHVRSMCYARCCWACLPTTPHWSRGTSSSCARISKPMRR
ncbi:exodeoxyribonuclease V, gamma subunit [Mycobacteroides abscessus subsp. abscessus]|nr:exodeoxyribonuclease V, gamma subunit [Mycobacteroides abscessus subsp. abscessus]